MDTKHRICLQRQKVQEALGVLRGVAELFGAEERVLETHMDDLHIWQEKINSFENWVFDESPIA